AQPHLYAIEGKVAMVYREITTYENHPEIDETTYRVDLSFRDANTEAPEASEQYNTHLNFYDGRDPGSNEEVKGYGRLLYPGIYPNIDFHLYGHSFGTKLAFVLHPGADPNDLVLHFDGQDILDVVNGNEIELYMGSKDIAIPQSIAYQADQQGNITPLLWSPTYSDQGNGDVKLHFGTYDPNQELIILFGKPETESNGARSHAVVPPHYMSYFGGSGQDEIRAVTTDDVGNTYIAGVTNSTDLPIAGLYRLNGKLQEDGFVASFDANFVLQWVDYFASDQREWINDIAWTAFGNRLYFVGTHDEGPHQSNLDIYDAPGPNYFQDLVTGRTGFFGFVDALSGNRVLLSVIGSELTSCKAIDADPVSGEFVIVGKTEKLSGQNCSGSTQYTTLPICDNTPGGTTPYFQQTNGVLAGTSYTNSLDGWFAIFNPNASLRICSFFGGGSHDAIRDVAMDPANQRIYMVGTTSSEAPTPVDYCSASSTGTFPICNTIGSGAFFRPELNAVSPMSTHVPDGFVAGMSYNAELDWCTYLGGIDIDGATSVAVSPTGKVAVTGFTRSWTFNTQANLCASAMTDHFPVCYTNTQYSGHYNPQTAIVSYQMFLSVFGNNGNMEYSILDGGQWDEAKVNWSPNEFSPFSTFFPEVAIDENENYFVQFTSWSNNQSPYGPLTPVQANGFYYQDENADLEHTGNDHRSDVIVLGIDANYNQKLMTYLGGVSYDSHSDWSDGIATHQSRVIVVGGTSSQSHFGPFCDGSFQYCAGSSLTIPNQHFSAGYLAELNKRGWPLSINETPKEGTYTLEVFPNPLTQGEHLNLQLPEVQGELVVLNTLGKVVYQQRPNQVKVQLDISHLPPGAYMVLWQNEKQWLGKAKFVIH
ncbi:MAG: T9SS type A sorting domain-containing protein, partial [Salibacteraceae bacterium]